MARPYSMTVINDIPFGETVQNVLAGLRGRTLQARAMIEIFMNAEDVDVSVGVTVGATEALPAGSRVTLNATVGDMPSTRDDRVIRTFGNKGDEIVVQGVNGDAAAAAELRLIVWVTEIDDIMLVNFVEKMRAEGSL